MIQEDSTQPQQEDLAPVAEPTLQFKAITDRDVYKIVSEKNSDLTLIEITGYGVEINFNMEYLKSIEDINAATEAIGVLFKEIILEKLLETNK